MNVSDPTFIPINSEIIERGCSLASKFAMKIKNGLELKETKIIPFHTPASESEVTFANQDW